MYDSNWYKLIMYGLEFVGRYYSSYRGFVIDNDDPKGMNRIKVISPTLNSFDNVEGEWAYPKSNWGAKGYGIHLLPQKGDMVWVEFEYGDLEHPIWSFASYGLDEKPVEFDSPNKYGFKTPAGNIIIIDDTEELESILVKHNNSKEYIKLVKDKLTLEGVQIYLGVDGDEKAVMGETLKTQVENICSSIEDLSSQVSTLGNGVVSIFPGGAAVAIQAGIITSQITAIRTGLDIILSNKVKIDKD